MRPRGSPRCKFPRGRIACLDKHAARLYLQALEISPLTLPIDPSWVPSAHRMPGSRHASVLSPPLRREVMSPAAAMRKYLLDQSDMDQIKPFQRGGQSPNTGPPDQSGNQPDGTVFLAQDLQRACMAKYKSQRAFRAEQLRRKIKRRCFPYMACHNASQRDCGRSRTARRNPPPSKTISLTPEPR